MISKKYMLENQNLNQNLGRPFFPPKQEEYKKCILCVSDIDCSTNLRREVCKASLGVQF